MAAAAGTTPLDEYGAPTTISATDAEYAGISPSAAAYYAYIANQNPGANGSAYQGPSADQVGGYYFSQQDAQNAADIYDQANAAGNPVYGATQQAQLANDISTGDFSDAWKYAASFGNAANAATVEGSGPDGYYLYNTSDPNQALASLINPQSLQALDPNYQWNAQTEQQFYQAAQPYDSSKYLGTPDTTGYNTSMQWGDPSKLAADATTNFNAGYAPNFSEFAGQQTPLSLGDKVGNAMQTIIPDLVLTAAGVITGGAASAALGGGLAGGIAGGAAAGAVGAAGNDVVNNQALTLGSVGKGAVLGAVGGGITSGLGGVNTSLSTGIQNTTGLGSDASNLISSGLVKTGVGAVTGALGAGLNGGNVGAGFTGGLERGAIGAGTGTAGNFIAGQVGSLFTPGSDPTQTDNGGIPSPGAVPPYLQPNNPSNMSTPDPFGDPTEYPYDPSTDGNGPLLPNSGLDPNFANIQPGAIDTTGADPGSQGDLNLGTNGTGAAGGSALAALLSKLLGGGGGNGAAGGSAGSSSLLAQLLGIGSTAAGGALNSNAAKSAAGAYAGQTSFNPYSINTSNGSTSFNGNTATSNLAPGAQQTSDALTGMNNGLIGQLAQGPGADATANFNSLTSSQLQAQQRLMANTQDNEFGNGVLGSTAGQYQTQGALGAIGQQIGQDQVTANNMASQQQQNQLAQLTAGLNGNNQLNASQLAQIQQGSTTGNQASGANAVAYQPSLAANSNSNIGNLLTGLGNGISSNSGQANNSALAQFLASLGG